MSQGFEVGDLVQLVTPKGRRHTIRLSEKGVFGTHKGEVKHSDIIGLLPGAMVEGSRSLRYLLLRPTLADATTVLPRGAAIVYPKDAAQILMEGDIYPGARVLEAGVGSGALSCHLIRAVGAHGKVTSVELRPDFAEIAAANIRGLVGDGSNWEILLGDLSETVESFSESSFDRVVLDMLRPWQHFPQVARVIELGGILTCFVTTSPQLSRVIEELRGQRVWAELRAWETIVRDWHVDELAVRPEHRMIGHSGFLVTARRVMTLPNQPRLKANDALEEDLLAWTNLPETEVPVSAKRLKKVASRAKMAN